MKYFYLLTLMSISLSSFGGTVIKKTVCPNVTLEGQSLISKVQTLRDELKQRPECKPIADQLSEVNDIITNDTWKNFKDIVTGEESVSLEGSQIEELSELTEKVSYSIAQTVSMITDAGCVPAEKKAGFLGTIAGVTKEVSNIVGSVTGPYGMAVSLGGNLLSGAISGIDQFFKSKRIYNFYNKEEELLFMNQFCSFTEVKKDVADFLGMENRINELGNLKKYLNKKEEDLVTNCPLCDAYVDVWNTKFKANKIVTRIKENTNIRENAENPNDFTTYTKCSDIAKAVYTSNSDLKQLYRLFEEYKNKLDGITDPIVFNQIQSDREFLEMLIKTEEILPQMFPALNECFLLSDEEKLAVSKSFNDFLRDEILSQNEKIFGKLQSIFRGRADKKYKNPLGDYTAKTKERLVWLEKQARKVQKNLKDPNRSSDTQNIRETHEKLEDRIVSSLMPAYLSFSIKRNKRYIKNFRIDLYNFRKNQLKIYKNSFNAPVNTISELIEQLKETKIVDARIYLSEQRKIFDKLQIALEQSKNLKRYCDYLKYTTSIVSRNKQHCTSGLDSITSAYETLNEYHTDIKSMHGFDAWANDNLDIQSSRVSDYANHIREWTERGSERWELYTPVSEEPSVAQAIQQEIDRWINQDMFEEN